MRSYSLATVGLLLVACPKRGPEGPKAPVGVGCPTASNVHLASYLSPEDGANGHTGWVLPLHDQVVESLDGVAEYATIDAVAAKAAGVPTPPDQLWLMLPNQAPCRVTYGSYYAAAIDAPTKNIAYGIELAGCTPPANSQLETAIALASAEPPGQCSIIAPKPAAARVGTTSQDGTWQRPTSERPVPAAIASLIPERACVAPACEKLWAIGEVELGGKPIAWAGAVNWLATSEAPACAWKAETWSGFFVAGPDGAPVEVKPQEHALPLFAVLADGGGARVLLASGPGSYTAYDYSSGAVTVGRHLVWLRPHPDSYAEIDHLGPECP